MIAKLTNMNLIEKLKALTGQNRNATICEVNFHPGYNTVFLFPTYDVYLNEQQYMALRNFLTQLNEKTFYVLNYYTLLQEKSYQVLTDHEFIYQLNSDTSYEEYTDLFLTEMSYIVSENFNWFIAIEESIENGMGIFVADRNLIALFQKCYPQYRLDLDNLLAAANNPNGEHLKRILAMRK